MLSLVTASSAAALGDESHLRLEGKEDKVDCLQSPISVQSEKYGDVFCPRKAMVATSLPHWNFKV